MQVYAHPGDSGLLCLQYNPTMTIFNVRPVRLRKCSLPMRRQLVEISPPQRARRVLAAAPHSPIDLPSFTRPWMVIRSGCGYVRTSNLQHI
jgi:hypothetical protein